MDPKEHLETSQIIGAAPIKFTPKEGVDIAV